MKKTMLVLVTAWLTTALQADVILSTDFNCRTLSGTAVTSNQINVDGNNAPVSRLPITTKGGLLDSSLNGQTANALVPKKHLTSHRPLTIAISLGLEAVYMGNLSEINFLHTNVNGTPRDTQNTDDLGLSNQKKLNNSTLCTSPK